MEFSEEEIEEFRTEASDLLDEAEKALLAHEKDTDLAKFYDPIFRALHSIKGGAGMLGLSALQDHTHAVETLFSHLKGKPSLEKPEISFFLRSFDASRKLLAGEPVSFDYNIGTPSPATSSALTETQKPEATTTPASAGQTQQISEVAPAPTKPVSTEASTPKSEGKKVVFVIDDEQDVGEIISLMLGSHNIQCRIFTNHQTFFDALKSDPPALVLADFKMPEMNGLELLKKLRGQAPDLPVCFVSGYLDKNTLMEAMNYGLFGALDKPIDERVLVSMVFNAIRLHEVTRLFNRSINLLLYQYYDLDQFLAKSGQEDIRRTVKAQMEEILKNQRSLRDLFRRKNP